MSRPATSRLKVNPPLGHMPALQYLLPAQLKIDATYQRSLDTGPSLALIRRIAQFWNWDLCQPLVVARRENGDLYVIDGQHRLEAARMRGDIPQLPAVVVQYASAADEAASFVHLNQQRRPLSKLDVFKAAVASGDDEAVAIANALEECGLSIAPHGNYTTWKPGMVSNIGGIEQAWRNHGQETTVTALKVLRSAFAGQRLQFAGTIFPGIVAVVALEKRKPTGRKPGELIELLTAKSQKEWRAAVMSARADDPNLRYNNAVAKVFLDAWNAKGGIHPAVRTNDNSAPPPAPKIDIAPPTPDSQRWCDQCDKRVSLTRAALCKDRFCKVRPALVASK